MFPDEDDQTFDSPIDALAGGLDTFVTSDYNYAKHLRYLSLGTLSAGDKAEMAYKAYVYGLSCGKFMNTLLVLTLKKAHALESFRWNIRVELSRAVYKALHQIKSLCHLHIRMQAGMSLYEPPPPLPYKHVCAASPWVSEPQPGSNGLIPVTQASPVLMPTSSYYTSASSGAPAQSADFNNESVHLVKPTSHLCLPKELLVPRDPPTLSGFRDLRAIAILDIDTLDITSELRTCIQRSASTVTKLKISFSDCLASQARAPPPDSDPINDEDEDEEFQAPVSNNTNHLVPDYMTGPAKAVCAAQMRKRQEEFLGTVFGVDSATKSPDDGPRGEESKDSPGDDEKIPGDETGASSEPINAGEAYIESIRDVADKLTSELGKKDKVDIFDFMLDASRTYVESLKLEKRDDILYFILDAFRKYLESLKLRKPDDGGKQPESDDKGADNVGSGQGRDRDETASSPASASGGDIPFTSNISEPSNTKNFQKHPTADEIDVEQPLEQLSLDDLDGETEISNPPVAFSNGSTSVPYNGDTSESKDKSSQEGGSHAAKEKGQVDAAPTQDTQKPLRTVKKNIQEARDELQKCHGEVGRDSQVNHMSDYVRSTRGIGLKCLGLHQIPIKAWTILRAIDFRSLRHIALLSVGNQTSLWLRLSQLNKVEPLPLTRIFTDHVTCMFLALVSELKEVKELFMLERSSRYKPESLVGKTTIKMADIRKIVLKKHLPHLRRLMIKNEGDVGHDNHHDASGNANWDVDERTMLLICRRGKALQELSISAGIKSIVSTFLHHPPSAA